MAPLTWNAAPCDSTQTKAPEWLSIPQPPRTEPVRPSSKLEPLDSKPASDFVAPAGAPREHGNGTIANGASEAGTFAHIAGFWQHAPRDLKTLVFAIPLLLALTFHPSLPKVRVAASPKAAAIRKDVQKAVNAQWVNVQRSVSDRAAVALDEDFRSGLDDWTSRDDATASWAFDASGFVRPGPLALYRPSLDLTDYQVQFLGLIDKKALSWVVRAQDFDNYYVIKLIVLKPGPLPTIGVTRYAVINGKAQDRADTPVLINAREDTLYRVRLDVQGDSFALAVQGQMIDNWSEPRLLHGGVGFFCAQGEDARLRWVQVTHQYDMLGRLCAYLAPYNISSTNGSWLP